MIAAALRRCSGSGPLLLADRAAPFLGAASSRGRGLSWQQVAASVVAGEPQLRVAAAGRLLAFSPGAPPPPLPEVPARRVQAGQAALAAAVGDADAPFALLEGGRLRWATPGFWLHLGLEDGVWVHGLFVHPEAGQRVEALAREAAAGLVPAFVRAVPLDGRSLLFRPGDLAASLAESRIRRLAAGWQLTPAERRELDHLRHGRTSKEAAALEGVSPETHRQRRRQIFAKAGVSTAGALRAALEGLPHLPRRRGRSG